MLIIKLYKHTKHLLKHLNNQVLTFLNDRGSNPLRALGVTHHTSTATATGTGVTWNERMKDKSSD